MNTKSCKITIKTLLYRELIFYLRWVLTFTSDAILHELHAVWTNTLVASYSVHACAICTRIILAFVSVCEKKETVFYYTTHTKTNGISKKRSSASTVSTFFEERVLLKSRTIIKQNCFQCIVSSFANNSS